MSKWSFLQKELHQQIRANRNEKQNNTNSKDADDLQEERNASSSKRKIFKNSIPELLKIIKSSEKIRKCTPVQVILESDSESDHFNSDTTKLKVNFKKTSPSSQNEELDEWRKKRNIFKSKLKTVSACNSEARSSATELISRRGVFSRHHYASVDQLPQTDLDGIDPSFKRFRVENGESLAEKDEVFGSPSTPVLENPEHQTRWYFKYFLGKLHQNYVGIDSEKNPYFLSVVSQDSGTQATPLYRAILFRKQGAQKIALPVSGSQKITVKHIITHFAGFDASTKSPKEIYTADIQKDLLLLEEQEGSVNFKFGVVYMKPGQNCDDEMLSNEEASEDFQAFLDLLGEKVRLKGWDRFRGGLDVKGDMTGKFSVYTMHEGHEIMFHVSTLLPYSRDNRQQVERKRHIGNDIVNIVFIDQIVNVNQSARTSPTDFDPTWIKSQFTHIFAVVTKSDDTYRLAIFCDENVPPFGPTLPNPPEFTNVSMFREFLLVKLINAEKATFQTPTFAQKRERTLDMLIKDLHEDYVSDSKLNMLNRRAFSEVLSDVPRTSKLKEDSRQIEFVRIGQALKLEAIVRGDAPTSIASASPCSIFKKPPWEPQCFYPTFPHRGTLVGDSFGSVDDCLFMATDDGTFLIKEDQSHQLVFDKTFHVRQLNVLEEHGILLIRGGSATNKDGHRIYVFRLKEFQQWHPAEPLQCRNRTHVKDRRIERTRGCHLYACSGFNGGHLRLIVAVGRKIQLFQWKHTAAWASWCPESDIETVDGFIFQKEIQLCDSPTIITVLEGPTNTNAGGLLCIGYRYHYEIVCDQTGTSSRLHEVELSKRSKTQLTAAIELCDGNETELLLCYNREYKQLAGAFCVLAMSLVTTSASTELPNYVTLSILDLKLCQPDVVKLNNKDFTSSEFDFHWNTSPTSVVCAFPYILGFTSDSIEIRLLVNGNLVHTTVMPELKLISSKRDIFFVTTAPELITKDLNMKGLQINEIASEQRPTATSSDTSSNEELSTMAITGCTVRRESQIHINPENELHELLELPSIVTGGQSPQIQRARSLQKTHNHTEDQKPVIAKSNSCGDSYRGNKTAVISGCSTELPNVPPNSPHSPGKTSSSPISPTRRNSKYRNIFISSANNNNNYNNNNSGTLAEASYNSPDRLKPLRIFRIPLAKLTGTHSHFHMRSFNAHSSFTTSLAKKQTSGSVQFLTCKPKERTPSLE